MLPTAVLLVTRLQARPDQPIWLNLVLTLAIVAPIGPCFCRIAFQPIADASATLFPNPPPVVPPVNAEPLIRRTDAVRIVSNYLKG